MKTRTLCLQMSFLAVTTLSVLLSSSESFSQAPQEELDLEEQFKITSKLIVMIKADRSGSEEFGAGIIFGRERDRLLIVTAYHVVNGSTTSGIGVQFRDMPGNKYLSARLLKHDKEWGMDLAVLSVEFPKKEGIDMCALPFDRLGKLADLKRGNLVYPVGNPNGVSWALPVAADKISEVNKEEITFQSAFISKGHSGGGLLDERGNLIGMTIADAPPFGRAINLSAILRLMKKCKYPVQLANPLPNRNTPLHVAARDENINRVKYLLTDCGDPNSLNDFNASPLHFAAYNRRDTAISVLLKAGANPNLVAEVGDGCLPLTLAIESGCFECAELLVRAGTKLNTQNKNGQTALHIAIDSARQKIALFLIESGVDVNLGDKGGETPLYYAIERKQVQVVKALLNAGAKVNMTVEKMYSGSRFNVTPLIRSIEANNLEIIEALLKAGARDDLGNYSPILKAIDEKNPDIIRLLGGYGVNMNIVNSGQTDNHPRYKNLSPLEYSISRYFSISKYDDVDGARADIIRCIEVLIQAGARINDLGAEIHTTSIETNKHRPINFAIVKFFSTANNEWDDCIELLKYLVKSGAKLSLQDGDGSTALHQALGYYFHLDGNYETGRLKCLQFLLNEGADPNIINEKGETPLSLQHARYDSEISKLLRQHGGVDASTDALRVAVENGDAGTVKKILDIRGGIVNETDYRNDSPLHYAAHNGSTETISLLLKAGAIKDVQDSDGDTPLHWALRNGKLQAAEFLIKAGANVNKANIEGQTPLMEAVSKQSAEATKVLIAAGADIDVKAGFGYTPLMRATKARWKIGVIIFLKAGADVHAKGESGFTCLSLAKSYGYDDIESLLRSFGAKY